MSAYPMFVRFWPGRYRDPLVSLRVSGSRPELVIAVNGEIDMSNAHLLTELARRLLRHHPQRLVLDLSSVTFFGASGVNALVDIRSAVAGQAGQLVLRNPSRITRRVLVVTGLIDVFDICTAPTPASSERTVGHRR